MTHENYVFTITVHEKNLKTFENIMFFSNIIYNITEELYAVNHIIYIPG